MKKLRIWKIELHPLQILGILLPILGWETGSLVFKIITPKYAEIFLPSIERVLTVDLPALSAFYGTGMWVRGVAGESPQFLAGPSYAAALLVLTEHTMITLGRVLLGTLLGAGLGILLGLAVGWSEKLGALIEAPVLVVRMAPLLALIPLFIIWFGGQEIGRILYVTYAIFVMLFINTINAVRNVKPVYKQFALTLGASKGQMYRTIVFPAIIPELAGGIRVALGSAWAITVAAEYIGAQSGLGRLIILSEYFFYTGRMVVILIIFTILSAVLNITFLKINLRITKWMPRG